MLPDRTAPLWHVWDCPPAPGVLNMATDAALLTGLPRGHAVWRWYGWSEPTVSFGRNEQVRGRFTPESLAAAGLAAVRRPTGGRALLHDQELTYAVVLPLDRHTGWRVPYQAISTLLRDALRAAGVPVEVAPARPVPRPEGPVCFDAPDAGELLLDGRKLVGSAVWRQDDMYLQHGSILLTDRQVDLQDAAAVDLPPVPPAASLDRLVPDHQLADAITRIKTAVHAALAGHTMHGAPTPLVQDTSLQDAIAAQCDLFARDAWLWRR